MCYFNPNCSNVHRNNCVYQRVFDKTCSVSHFKNLFEIFYSFLVICHANKVTQISIWLSLFIPLMRYCFFDFSIELTRLEQSQKKLNNVNFILQINITINSVQNYNVLIKME